MWTRLRLVSETTDSRLTWNNYSRVGRRTEIRNFVSGPSNLHGVAVQSQWRGVRIAFPFKNASATSGLLSIGPWP